MYCINPNDDEPIFCLFDQIGCDESNPTRPFVDGNQFAKELLYMDGEGKKRIQIWINSEGGSIKDGFSIAAAMLKTKTKIDTLVIGIAYSMAGVLALMGRKVEAMDFSSLMYHMGYNPDGTADKGLDVINKSLITAVATRWGKSEDEVRKVLEAETFYTAQEAFAAGLIDNIVTSDAINMPRQLSDTKAKYEFGVAYKNKLLALDKPKQMNKKEICDLLGLDENVSDAVAMDAFKAYKAKADAAIKALAKKKDEKEEEEESTEMKALKASNEEMAAKLKAKEDAEKALAQTTAAESAKAKAKVAIVAKLTERKITIEDKAVDNYVALAGTSEETLKTVIETIEAIPVTMKAAALSTKSVNEKAAEGLSIALIPAGGAEEKSPIAVAAGDTSAMINSINSFDVHRDWVNRKRN